MTSREEMGLSLEMDEALEPGFLGGAEMSAHCVPDCGGFPG